jgi:hypothetical protein
MEASLWSGPHSKGGLEVVGAIMPEAMRSGKQKAGAADMPSPCGSDIFRKAEWP